MTSEGFRCERCSNCPYYEQITSYGKEQVECGNTDCILHGLEDMEVDE